ncbi:MAG: hypothetical protein ICV87_06225 [Gemmatimonadetes bacterium]|nr:hypothetical protein [Gemmatimonadota bacterium]
MALDIAFWALPGVGRDVAPRVFLPIVLLTFVFIAIAVALVPGRHRILASASVSGGAVVFAWLAKVPLTLMLPGLIQRDHDAWVVSVISESLVVGGHAAVAASVLAAGTRLVASLWSWHRARSAM